MLTSRSGSPYGRGRSSTPLTRAKIATAAPMPMMSVSDAVRLKAGLRRRERQAGLMIDDRDMSTRVPVSTPAYGLNAASVSRRGRPPPNSCRSVPLARRNDEPNEVQRAVKIRGVRWRAHGDRRVRSRAPRPVDQWRPRRVERGLCPLGPRPLRAWSSGDEIVHHATIAQNDQALVEAIPVCIRLVEIPERRRASPVLTQRGQRKVGSFEMLRPRGLESIHAWVQGLQPSDFSLG